MPRGQKKKIVKNNTNKEISSSQVATFTSVGKSIPLLWSIILQVALYLLPIFTTSALTTTTT